MISVQGEGFTVHIKEIAMNRHYHTLELDKILLMLAEETSIEEAGELAEKIEPQSDIDKVERLLTQTEDAHKIGRAHV